MFTVYVLQSLKDGGYYIGQTESISKRLSRHNLGMVKSTARRRPWKVIYTETFSSRALAIQRERQLKRQKGGDIFRKIIHPR
ncbi:MAG: GIY-YIG nuclease family protein [Patescibacteria group bacterium]